MTEAEIADLCARYPLPDGAVDCVLSREQLAEALDVSKNTVDDWINKGMPVQTHGDRGRAYELLLSACHAWNEARKASEDLLTEKQRAAVASMRLAIIGGKSGNSIEALPPKERKEILSVQIEQERFQRARNELIPRSEVQECFELAFSLIRDSNNGAPDDFERQFAFEPKVVDALIDHFDKATERVRRVFEQFFHDRPLIEEKHDRTDLFDA